MAFTVHLSDASHHYGDEAEYKFRQDGYLWVNPADEEKIVIYRAWTYFEADTDHTPGSPKGGGKKGSRAAFVG